MNSYTKFINRHTVSACVFLFFITSAAVRFWLGNFSKVIGIYHDELCYYAIAKSLSVGHGVMVQNLPYDYPKILYSILLLPAFYLPAGSARITIITLINAITISSGIFPTYLIINKISNNRKISLVGALFYILLPDMWYSAEFMSEVLFLPLALWCVYALLQLLLEDTGHPYRWVAGYALFLTLSIFTKEVAMYIHAAWLGYIILYGLLQFFLTKHAGVREKNYNDTLIKQSDPLCRNKERTLWHIPARQP